ncbi:MAG: MFS transporter [Saprospiraceae bacterium]|nr:MFS transporter [Saprospiraceae bacterium]
MKNRHSILLLLLANFISAVSQGMSMIAIPWYFTSIDGMAQFGWIYVLTNVMAFFWVPYSGLLTDRFERRKILMVVMGILGAIILSVGLLGIKLDGLPWLVVASVFVLTFLNYNIHFPTLYALVQEMTELKYYGRIASVIEIQGQTAMISAGAIAAILLSGTTGGGVELFGYMIENLPEIEAWDIHEIFIVDGITYFLGLIILTMIKYRPSGNRESNFGTLRSRIRTGLNFLASHPYITIFGLASYAVFVSVLIERFYLLAPYVSEHLEAGANVYAAGEMTYSMGAFLAGFTVQYIFRRIHLTDSIILMTTAVMALFMILFLTQSFVLFYVLGFVLGLCNSGIRIQRVTYLFSRVPNEVYGRVNSVFNMGNILFRIVFLACFSLPFFQQGRNIIYAFLILSLFLVCAIIVLLLYRKRIIIDHNGE